MVHQLLDHDQVYVRRRLLVVHQLLDHDQVHVRRWLRVAQGHQVLELVPVEQLRPPEVIHCVLLLFTSNEKKR